MTRYLSYGQKYPDYGFYCKCFGMIISKVPGLRIKVPELRVLPYDAFIIGEKCISFVLRIRNICY